VRVIVANILSSVITPMLPLMKSSLSAGGQAILAGIMTDEASAMVDALAAGGWAIEREDTEDIWWSVQIALR
jgi:ribosomal protein L11 methylase PrmA